ncbi:MAG: hypothetical protein Q7S27_01635 [Nanoarchaeota archaeon]|nr:hypothetical protein [Nanoarchaeota archaeon]
MSRLKLHYPALGKYIGNKVRITVGVEISYEKQTSRVIGGRLYYNSETNFYYIQTRDEKYDLFRGDRIQIDDDVDIDTYQLE